MDKKKFYTKTKEINGKKYVAQFNGMSLALRATDETYIDGTEITSTQKMTAFILENVIVDPKNLTADDFECAEELNEVVKFGSEVMNGKFRNDKDGAGAKAKGEE